MGILFMNTENKECLVPHPVLTEYYKDENARRRWVVEMFDSSARHYDWITRAMSFGSGKWYRRQALERSGLKPGMNVLDVGSGTGLLAYLAENIIDRQGTVVALDPSSGMLGEAKALGVRNVVQGVGGVLPFADETFDRVVMGYALRHVADLNSLFAEYRRVLKPNGKVLLLEITRPESPMHRAFLKFYMKGVVPTVTRLFCRSKQAQELMRYYWDTIDQCVPPETILAAMAGAGLDQPQRHMVLGIFSEYTNTVPEV